MISCDCPDSENHRQNITGRALAVGITGADEVFHLNPARLVDERYEIIVEEIDNLPAADLTGSIIIAAFDDIIPHRAAGFGSGPLQSYFTGTQLRAVQIGRGGRGFYGGGGASGAPADEGEFVGVGGDVGLGDFEAAFHGLFKVGEGCLFGLRGHNQIALAAVLFLAA